MELGILFTILGSFCSFLDWEGADIRPQNRPRIIPVLVLQSMLAFPMKGTNVAAA